MRECTHKKVNLHHSLDKYFSKYPTSTFDRMSKEEKQQAWAEAVKYKLMARNSNMEVG